MHGMYAAPRLYPEFGHLVLY